MPSIAWRTVSHNQRVISWGWINQDSHHEDTEKKKKNIVIPPSCGIFHGFWRGFHDQKWGQGPLLNHVKPTVCKLGNHHYGNQCQSFGSTTFSSVFHIFVHNYLSLLEGIIQILFSYPPQNLQSAEASAMEMPGFLLWMVAKSCATLDGLKPYK